MLTKTALSVSLFLAFMIAPPAILQTFAQTRIERPAIAVKAKEAVRTELYFGRNISDGGIVSDAEWDRFLSEVVTPAFPEGLTVIDALGQFREDSGLITTERSKILILIYPKKTRKASSAKIEAIRAAYIKMFHQTAVMRIDLNVKLF